MYSILVAQCTPTGGTMKADAIVYNYLRRLAHFTLKMVFQGLMQIEYGTDFRPVSADSISTEMALVPFDQSHIGLDAPILNECYVACLQWLFTL